MVRDFSIARPPDCAIGMTPFFLSYSKQKVIETNGEGIHRLFSTEWNQISDAA